MQLCTKDGQPMFHLVLIQGEDTQALLDAMEAKADALDAGQAGNTPPSAASALMHGVKGHASRSKLSQKWTRFVGSLTA